MAETIVRLFFVVPLAVLGVLEMIIRLVLFLVFAVSLFGTFLLIFSEEEDRAWALECWTFKFIENNVLPPKSRHV